MRALISLVDDNHIDNYLKEILRLIDPIKTIATIATA